MKETEEYRPLLAGISDREGTELCAQLRQELVDDVSKTGGHLASNLGAVELTVEEPEEAAAILRGEGSGGSTSGHWNRAVE